MILKGGWQWWWNSTWKAKDWLLKILRDNVDQGWFLLIHPHPASVLTLSPLRLSHINKFCSSMFPSPYQHSLSSALIHLPDRNLNWKKMMHPSQILHLNIILFRRWTWQQQGSLRGETGAWGKLASNHENHTFWLFEPTPCLKYFLAFLVWSRTSHLLYWT